MVILLDYSLWFSTAFLKKPIRVTKEKSYDNLKEVDVIMSYLWRNDVWSEAQRLGKSLTRADETEEHELATTICHGLLYGQRSSLFRWLSVLKGNKCLEKQIEAMHHGRN